MFDRRIRWALPLLVGCNSILDIQPHELQDNGGSAGTVAPSGGSSAGGTSQSGAPSTNGGSQSGNPGSDEAGSEGEGGNALGGASSLGGGSNGGTTGASPNGGAASSGGSAKATGGDQTSGGGKGSAGSASGSGASNNTAAGASGSSANSGGAATASGGAITSNACNLGCPTNQVCVDGACVDCRNGERRCSSEGVPLACLKQSWVAEPACAGSLPLCSNGSCVGLRLLGGLVSDQGSLGASKVRLVRGGLELLKPTCGGAGKCFVGGLRP